MFNPEEGITLDKYVLDWFEEQEPDEKARHEAINEVLLKHIRDQRFSNTGQEQPGMGVETQWRTPGTPVGAREPTHE